MKRIGITVAMIGCCLLLKAQILHPVHWEYSARKLNGTEAVVSVHATMDKGWHIYSQRMKDGGPVKTSIRFTPSDDFILVGNTSEPKPISKMETAYDMEVSYFENSVSFQQKIKLKKGPTTIRGTLEYMTCNDKQCLPPDTIDFSVVIK